MDLFFPIAVIGFVFLAGSPWIYVPNDERMPLIDNYVTPLMQQIQNAYDFSTWLPDLANEFADVTVHLIDLLFCQQNHQHHHYALMNTNNCTTNPITQSVSSTRTVFHTNSITQSVISSPIFQTKKEAFLPSRNYPVTVYKSGPLTLDINLCIPLKLLIITGYFGVILLRINKRRESVKDEEKVNKVNKGEENVQEHEKEEKVGLENVQEEHKKEKEEVKKEQVEEGKVMKRRRCRSRKSNTNRNQKQQHF